MRVVLFFDEFPNINLIVCYHFADIKLWKQTCQVFCKTIHVAVSVSEHSFSHTVTYFERNFFFSTFKRTFQFFAVSFIHNLHFICLCADNTRIQGFTVLDNNCSVNRTTAIRHFYCSTLFVGIIAICCRFTIHCSRQRSWRVEDTQLIGTINRYPANSTLARRDNVSAHLTLTSLRKVDNCVLEA